VIKAGIFDIGGVIIKYAEEFAFEPIIKALAITEDAFRAALKVHRYPLSVGEITEEVFWSRFLQSLGKEFDPSELAALYREAYAAYLKELNLIDTVLVDYVRMLKGKGINLGVIANTIPQNVDVYRALGIYNDYAVLTLSCFEGVKKPNPEIFSRTLEKLDVKPQEAFFVDDSERHVLAAGDLGIAGVLHSDTKNTIEQLSTLVEN
jgi:putative hydrolase of the HAD superfamily